MNTMEKLLDEYPEVYVIENYNFKSNNIKGLYCDGVVALNKSLPLYDKLCVLAEEIGHHITSYGDIIDLTAAKNSKQEHKARTWAYFKLVSLGNIVDAYEHGHRTVYDIADFLGITEQFLIDALNAYKIKYGLSIQYENYIINFIPTLELKRQKEG